MHWLNSPLLETLIHKPRLGLLTDMDGTISPIVAHPDLAHVTPRSRELLKELGEELELVAVVSGRAVADIRARVDLPQVVYVGNHGFEFWENGQASLLPEVAASRPGLEAVRDTLPLKDGMFIEDKNATLSIHYRLAADPAAVEAEYTPLLREMASLHHLSFFQGRKIFELRPPLEIHKGTAMTYLVTQYRLDAAIFIGDDITDTDAFQTAQQLREQDTCFALAMAVTWENMPEVVREKADVLAHGITDVEDFLDWLLKARVESAT